MLIIPLKQRDFSDSVPLIRILVALPSHLKYRFESKPAESALLAADFDTIEYDIYVLLSASQMSVIYTVESTKMSVIYTA